MLNILKVELIKLKSSSLITVIIILTLAPLYNGISVSRKLSAIDSNPNTLEAIYDFSINLYTLLFLPTIIIITFAIIMRLERVSGGVKEILALPVTKKQLFLSKQIIGILLVVISILSFFIILIVSAYFQKGITMKGISIILSRLLKIFLVSLGAISIQFYLSINYENISVPLGIGFCFQIPAFLLGGSKYEVLYPWSYMTAINNSTGIDSKTVIMIFVSITIFIVVNLIGYIKFNNKDIC